MSFPMIRDTTRSLRVRALQRFRSAVGKIRLPDVVFEVDPDKTIDEIWSTSLEAVEKFTEDGAIAFAQEAAAVIRDHIANFSMPTTGGRLSKIGEFDPHEKLDRSSKGLYSSIGWDHRLFHGNWEGIAGVGIGGKHIPLNPSGKPYAHFVERGSGKTSGRFVPKVADVTLTDLSDPTRQITFQNVPTGYLPKMSPQVNPLLEGFWASRKRRALLKKRARKQFGRYMEEPTGAILEKKLKGTRKLMSKARPTYNIEGIGGPVRAGARPGYGLQYYRRKHRQKEPASIKHWKRWYEQAGGDTDRMFDLANEWFEANIQDFDEYLNVMGGKLRGFGGKHNILRSVGDINFAMFTIDLRTAIHELGKHNYGMLDGLPGYVGGEVHNERGLGARLRTGKHGDPGEHPGTPARNFMKNSAAVMARWVARVMREGGMIKRRGKQIRVFEQ